MAEYWDIFDMDRRSTGRQHLRGTPMADGDYHLVVNIWVVNSAGQVLLTQRHPDIPFGLKWACTGGSAITGEDTLTAALRETREEIGLEVLPQQMVPVAQERRLHSFLDTFVVCMDVKDSQIVMQPEEVVDFAGWMKRSTAKWSRMDCCTLLSKTFLPPIVTSSRALLLKSKVYVKNDRISKKKSGRFYLRFLQKHYTRRLIFSSRVPGSRSIIGSCGST